MCRPQLHGFTLIDLLVVIAIIALLMGILMPVSRKAKKQAWNVVCQSNLRQIGGAAGLFAHDHNSKIPRANDQQLAAPGGNRASARKELFMWDWTGTHTFQ